MGAIEGGIREAQALGEISADADPSQLAFETNAMLIGANLAFPLFGDPGILERARVGVRERLRAGGVGARTPVPETARTIEACTAARRTLRIVSQVT